MPNPQLELSKQEEHSKINLPLKALVELEDKSGSA